MDVINNNKKIIVLFPHTSPAGDSTLIFMHLAYDPEFIDVRSRIKMLVRGSNFYHPVWGPALNYFGGLPATHPDIKNGGSTEHINSILHKMEDGFVLLISPKGRTEKTDMADWKNGWYHIAKEHDATIVVAGLDFEQHRIVMAGDPMKIEGRSIEEMKKIIKPLYGYIVPLNVKASEVKVRNHSSSSIFDSGTGQSFMLLILFVLISSAVIILGLGMSPARVERVEASTTSLTNGTVGTTALLDLT
jgi:hypothetical protein